MQLSLSGFLFEDDYTEQSVSFTEFCAIARDAGYDGVELRRTQVNPETPGSRRAELLATADEAGLRITCLTARGLPSAGEDRERFFADYLDLCRDLRCPLLKIGGEPDWLREAAGRAERFGVTLATNNHVGGAAETVEGTRGLFAEVRHANFGLLYDSLHLYVAGEDYVGCIEEFLPVTHNILVHSVRPARAGEAAAIERGDCRWVAALPDEPGVQDWAAVLARFRTLGYGGWVTVIESGWPRDRRERVARRTAEVMRSLWMGGN